MCQLKIVQNTVLFKKTSALCSFGYAICLLSLNLILENVLFLKIKQVHVWSRRQPHARQCQKMKNHRRSTVWSIFSIWQGGLSDYKDKCYLKVLSLFVSVLIAKSNSSEHVCQKCPSFAGKVLKTYIIVSPGLLWWFVHFLPHFLLKFILKIFFWIFWNFC